MESIKELSSGDANQALVLQTQDRARLMPIFSIEQAVQRFNAVVEFVKTVMVKDKDFGVIEGTGNKPTLLKPGAEKLCTLFGLTPRFSIVEKTEDWTGASHDGEPFFYYLYRCSLYRNDYLIAEGDGSCNSREKKYRWRQGQRKCPDCQQAAIVFSNNKNAFFCLSKNGGCGKRFAPNETRLTSQDVGRVPNPDIADQVNTLQKMSQKRSLIAATLLAVNASEYFTQDLEDIEITDYRVAETEHQHPKAEAPAKPAASAPARQAGKPEPQQQPTPPEDSALIKVDPQTLEGIALHKHIKELWKALNRRGVFNKAEDLITDLRGFALDADWKYDVINKLADIGDDDLRDYAGGLAKRLGEAK